MISSLGHTLTLRGMYGAPRKLCTDTVRQLCRVAELLQPMNPIRLIAISTEGARPGFTQCAQASHSAPTACTACIVGPEFFERPIIGCIQLALGGFCCPTRHEPGEPVGRAL